MHLKQKQLYIFFQIFLSAAATAFLMRYLFSSRTREWLFKDTESLFCVIGIKCTTTAILLLMFYAAHEVKGAAAPLLFITVCKHVGRMVWKTMYKPLMFLCIAIITLQTAISLISSAMPHGFSEIIPTISSAILQTAFFYNMLARYVRANSVAQV